MNIRSLFFASSMKHGLEMHMILNGGAFVGLTTLASGVLLVVNMDRQLGFSEEEIVRFSVIPAFIWLFVRMHTLNFSRKLAASTAAAAAAGGYFATEYALTSTTLYLMGVLVGVWAATRLYSEGPRHYCLPQLL